MTNFDLDDPLGDLLSDGSNDSFFEEPKIITKKSNLTKKKSVSDLFDISKSDSKEINWLELNADTTKNIGQEKINISPKKPLTKISFEDENVLSNLKSEKLDLKRDIKKPDYTKRQIESTLKSANNEKDILFDMLESSKLSKKSDTITQPLSTFYPSSTEHIREGRRPQQSQGFTDYLGLFPTSSQNIGETDIDKSISLSPTKKMESTNDAKPVQIASTSKIVQKEAFFPLPAIRDTKPKSAPNVDTFPDWLQEKPLIEPHKSDTTLQSHNEKKFDGLVFPQLLQTTEIGQNQIVNSLEKQEQLAACDIEYQTATLSMQQQDMQLVLALHLKKYEENLVNMQKRQQELLSKQEKQFQSLLERQIIKQQVLESNLQIQQERINNHIQVLLSQSAINDVTISGNSDQIHSFRKKADESSHFYEDLINSLKQKSQEEKLLLEESYKKQISTLEKTMESVESRLIIERDKLLEDHKVKYDLLKQEYEADIEKYKERIEQLSVIHSNEIKAIRKNHDQIIEEIKYEYSTLIENIKETKQSENALFQNSLEYSQKLDASLKMLDINTKSIINIREKVDSDYNISKLTREESFKAKEEEIHLLREALEKARTTLDSERIQLLALIRSLEIKLVEQNQNLREERWAIQQATATLATRTVALDREAEFSRACLEREKEQLKTLKESLLAEKEVTILQLQEEKLALSAERARLETSTKLGRNYDTQRIKAEVDAAVEVAKKAAELTDIERSNLHVVQCEVETLKRSLTDREHKLSLKEKELESAMEIAEKRYKDAEEVQALAKAVQRDYNEKLKDIQNQLVSLTIREKKLAEEKITLSKERQALQNPMRHMKRLTLCAIDSVPRIEEYDYSESI